MKILSSSRGHSTAIVSVFLIMLIIVTLIAGTVGCGSGGPIQIYNWYQLDEVRNNLDGSYILMDNLTVDTSGYFPVASAPANGGQGWEPIGSSDDPFTGTFDGNNKQIRDFAINRPTKNRAGLFGAMGGVVKNLGVVNAIVTGQSEVGGLAGWNGGTVTNCAFTGNVTGDTYVGGLVGANDYDRTVSDSHSTGSVTGNQYVGGLVGQIWWMGTVSNSYATSSVIGDDTVGGLVGVIQSQGTVSNSYATGNVTGSSSVGGLVGGIWEGAVSNSHYDYDEVLINGENIITIGALFDEDFEEWLANDKSLDVNEKLSQESGYYVINNLSDFKQLLAFGQDGSLKFRLKNDLDLATEPNFYIPYLAGEFDGNSHNISDLSFNFDFVSHVGLFGYVASAGNMSDVGAQNVNITGHCCVGGLLGSNCGTVNKCHSTGNMSGIWYIGGLIGANYGSVSTSYSAGNVTGRLICVGGLVGNNEDGAVDSSYATGTVTGEWFYVGGLVGMSWDWGTVSNSYSTGNVTGPEWVGGLVGFNGDESTVSNCYATGSVTSEGIIGGLVGGNGGTVSNSFWDTETSGQNVSAGGTGKNTTEMHDIDTFSGAVWNITAVAGPGERNSSYIWNIVDDLTYPFLNWQPV